MTRMHEDELELDEALVRRLLAEQFPDWSELPLRKIEPSGTVNAIFRLGDELSVRLPRRRGRTQAGSVLLDWLPRLAALLPVEIPVQVAQGRPSAEYPWFWEIHSWVEGEVVPTRTPYQESARGRAFP
jgi:aminoglycoside phosphotransferase (APT) family kinase protein